MSLENDWTELLSKTFVATVPFGFIRVRGADRVDLLHRLSTNDLRPLAEGDRVVPTVFANNKGRVVDWTAVASGSEDLLIRTSEGRSATVIDWVEEFTITEDVVCSDESAAWQGVVLQGPDAAKVVPEAAWPSDGEVREVEGVTWMRGPAAFGIRLEGWLPPDRVDEFLQAARTRGASIASDEVLELLRIRAGVPSPRYEYAALVNALDIGLQDSISWKKGCYIGQEVIARMDSYDKVVRCLAGVVADKPLEDGAAIFAAGGERVGQVTSSARLNENRVVGLALVRREALSAGGEFVAGEADGAQAVELDMTPFLGRTA